MIIENNSDFTSVEQDICRWLKGKEYQHLYAVYGCSMGGSIAFMTTVNQMIEIEHCVMDGCITPHILIIVILVIMVGAAIMPSVKHFKEQGGCCGGGGYKPKKKKLKNLITKKAFEVEGKHCKNCSNRVIEALNDSPQIAADVKLKKGIVIVSCADNVADNVIQEEIEKIG